MKIKCPYCQQHYEVEDNLTGLVICARCQREFEASSAVFVPSQNTKTEFKKTSDRESVVLQKALEKVLSRMEKTEKKKRNALEINLTIPYIFYFLAALSVLGTLIWILELEKNNPFYKTLLSAIISSGVVSTMLFIGMGRLIASGIVMESYITDLHEHLTQKNKE